MDGRSHRQGSSHWQTGLDIALTPGGETDNTGKPWSSPKGQRTRTREQAARSIAPAPPLLAPHPAPRRSPHADPRRVTRTVPRGVPHGVGPLTTPIDHRSTTTRITARSTTRSSARSTGWGEAREWWLSQQVSPRQWGVGRGSSIAACRKAACSKGLQSASKTQRVAPPFRPRAYVTFPSWIFSRF